MPFESEYVVLRMDGECAAELTSTTGAAHTTAWEIVGREFPGEAMDVIDRPTRIEFLGSSHDVDFRGELVLTPGPGFDLNDKGMEALEVYELRALIRPKKEAS